MNDCSRCQCDPCCSCCCSVSKNKDSSKQRGLLTEFVVDQPATLSGQAHITIDANVVPLALVRVVVDDVANRVRLFGTVGWFALRETPTVEFFITRTRPGGIAETIFSTRDEADTQGANEATTSFTFVDELPILTQRTQLVEYRLNARLVDNAGNPVIIVNGPIILTAEEFRANNRTN